MKLSSNNEPPFLNAARKPPNWAQLDGYLPYKVVVDDGGFDGVFVLFNLGSRLEARSDFEIHVCSLLI